MAEVFKAKASGAHGFEKTLAIKRILPDLARDPEFEQRFINEAKLAVKLSHANVVQVFDFGRFAGSLFIAMEYVEGLDLAAFLKVYRGQEAQVPLPSALYIAIEMARGLDFAHKHDVVHRDVSPSNILLSQAGEVKIADFGIAEALNKRERRTSNSGRIMGKWRYMSPEQTRGESLSIASDVFAAAAVMYELFIGEKLFPGAEAETIIKNIHGMEIPEPSAKRDELPERVDAILTAALERNPKRRPSAGEMLRELLETSYEASIVASPLGVADAVTDAIKKVVKEEPAPGLDLNELIRAQLSDGPGRAPTVRKTAVAGTGETVALKGDAALGHDRTATGPAVMTRAVVDGITVLEVDDTVVADISELSSDEPSRRTEVGEPRAVSAIAHESTGATDTGSKRSKALKVVELPIEGRRPRSVWPLAAALIATAGLAAGAAWVARGTDSPIEKLPVAVGDASTSAPSAPTLAVESDPSGAEVLINKVVHSEPTPFLVELEADVPYQLDFRLAGFDSVQDSVLLKPGQDLRIRPTLIRLRAFLEVVTRPAGATVYLDDKRLGPTPLKRSNLRPGRGRKLRIEKADFRTITVEVDLVADKAISVSRTLSSTIQYETVNIDIVKGGAGGWADVHLGGKKVGRAPGGMRLPVGTNRLVLKNPHTGASRTVTVTVVAGTGRTQNFRFSL